MNVELKICCISLLFHFFAVASVFRIVNLILMQLLLYCALFFYVFFFCSEFCAYKVSYLAASCCFSSIRTIRYLFLHVFDYCFITPSCSITQLHIDRYFYTVATRKIIYNILSREVSGLRGEYVFFFGLLVWRINFIRSTFRLIEYD